MPALAASTAPALDLFASDEHVAHEVIWSVYQNMADTYRKQAARGKGLDASRN